MRPANELSTGRRVRVQKRGDVGMVRLVHQIQLNLSNRGMQSSYWTSTTGYHVRMSSLAPSQTLRSSNDQLRQLIAQETADLIAIRRDLHAHPEIGYEEQRTGQVVQRELKKAGIEFIPNLAGGTGVMAHIPANSKGPAIGLRADMDALPILEETGLPYASTISGKMHACGHDGHTTILIGAARYLAETRDFAGTAVFVFQPAEEGLGGARAMLKDGLFEKFPCDEIYGLHNAPNRKPGRVSVFPGAAMAGADFFDFRIRGRGSHGARPNESRDPIIVA